VEDLSSSLPVDAGEGEGAGATVPHGFAPAPHDQTYPDPPASEGAETVEHRSQVDPGTVIPHRHTPTDVVSERFTNGLRMVTYRCDCGETLPERRA